MPNSTISEARLWLLPGPKDSLCKSLLLTEIHTELETERCSGIASVDVSGRRSQLCHSYINQSHACSTHILTIRQIWNPDNSQRWAYVPANETQFPHGWSPDIATIESFICSRLLSPCNANNVAVSVCQGAFDFFSGLTGEWAVAAWDTALGLGWNGEMQSCVSEAYATTTTVTVVAGPSPPPPPGSPPSPPTQTTVQESYTVATVTTETTSTLTETEETTSSPTKTPWTTLTITLTLPSSSTTFSSLQGTSTSTETLTYVSSVTTGVAGAAQTGHSGSGGDGGGSPFDSSASSRWSLDMLFLVWVGVLSCIVCYIQIIA